MKYGIHIEQKDICLVPFPFSNLREFKKRPVIVVSNNYYNKKFDDVIVCLITSRIINDESSILINNKDLESGLLKVKSRIKCYRILSIDKKIIIKTIAKLKEDKFKEVKEMIFKFF